MRRATTTGRSRLRNEKGLTQDDLAYEARVSRSYLRQLEKGVFYASLSIIGRLADTLEIEAYELLKPPPKRGRR